ncbi:MAG: hypothetical protein AAFV30_10720, partial [Pseudomonadota bacterium]
SPNVCRRFCRSFRYPLQMGQCSPRYTTSIVKFSGEFGVTPFVVSSDQQDRAVEAKQSWGLDKLQMGYGLTLQQGRDLGLYISNSRGKTSTGVVEPDLFVEPGLFLIKPDRTLYFGSVQTMPFARPQFAEIEGALKFVLANDYPARGEVDDIPS